MQRMEQQEAKNQFRNMRERTAESLCRGRETFDQQVAANPGASTVLSFVAGLGFGLLIAVLLSESMDLRGMGWTREHPTERWMNRLRHRWEQSRPHSSMFKGNGWEKPRPHSSMFKTNMFSS